MRERVHISSLCALLVIGATGCYPARLQPRHSLATPVSPRQLRGPLQLFVALALVEPHSSSGSPVDAEQRAQFTQALENAMQRAGLVVARPGEPWDLRLRVSLDAIQCYRSSHWESCSGPFLRARWAARTHAAKTVMEGHIPVMHGADAGTVRVAGEAEDAKIAATVATAVVDQVLQSALINDVAGARSSSPVRPAPPARTIRGERPLVVRVSPRVEISPDTCVLTRPEASFSRDFVRALRESMESAGFVLAAADGLPVDLSVETQLTARRCDAGRGSSTERYWRVSAKMTVDAPAMATTYVREASRDYAVSLEGVGTEDQARRFLVRSLVNELVASRQVATVAASPPAPGQVASGTDYSVLTSRLSSCEPRRVLALPLRGDSSIGRTVATTAAGELATVHDLTTFTLDDIGAVLEMERQRDLLGCTEATCITEIAGAIQADLVLHGAIERAGEGWSLQMSLVDVRSLQTVASAARVLSPADEVLAAVPEMVLHLASMLATYGCQPRN